MKIDRNQDPSTDRGWGGARPGAGRKPSPQQTAIHNLPKANLSADQWSDLFDQLCEDGMDRNLNAIKLLLHYRFGNPTVQRDPHPGSRPELAAEPSPGLIQ